MHSHSGIFCDIFSFSKGIKRNLIIEKDFDSLDVSNFFLFLDSKNYEIKLLSYHVVNRSKNILQKNDSMYSKKKNLNGENAYSISVNWMHLVSLWFAKLCITSITVSATNQRTNEFDIALTNTKLLRFFFVIFRSHPSFINHAREKIYVPLMPI